MSSGGLEKSTACGDVQNICAHTHTHTHIHSRTNMLLRPPCRHYAKHALTMWGVPGFWVLLFGYLTLAPSRHFKALRLVTLFLNLRCATSFL